MESFFANEANGDNTILTLIIRMMLLQLKRNDDEEGTTTTMAFAGWIKWMDKWMDGLDGPEEKRREEEQRRR